MYPKKSLFVCARECVAFGLVYTLIIMSFGAFPAAAQERKLFDKFSKADAVTNAVRDKGKILQRVNLRGEAERRNLEKFGKIVEDYGEFVLIATGAKTDLSRFDAQKIETTVNLPGRKFEPVLAPPAETLRPNVETANSDEKDYFLVQFAGSAKDEWLESLREIGAEVLQYVPHNAFFVYADGEAMTKVAAHSRVRWAGRYLAEDKISPDLQQNLSRRAENETAVFEVAVFNRADANEVAGRISNSFGARVLHVTKLPTNFFNVIRVEIPVGAIDELAQIKDVVRIDPYVKPQREDERSAQIVAGNYTNTFTLLGPGYNPFSQFGVNGQGVSVAVVDDGVAIPGDGGFYITAAKAVDANLRNASAGALGHGHLNATIIAGDAPFSTLDPNGYNYGLGVAPKANIINVPLQYPNYNGTFADTINDTINTVPPNGVTGTIANNSWGAGGGGNSYDSLAAQYDGFVQDGSFDASFNPMTIIFSAGNSGAGGMTRPKSAKNIITVANSENLRPHLDLNANNIDDLHFSSSRGPASDGRIKPDITAPGTVITGGRAGSSFIESVNIDNFHRYSTGTSHAAPHIAGAAALFTQFWKQQSFGQNPSPALVKAAILNTAQEMNGFGSDTPIPNGNEGWGRINMKYMLNPGVPVRHVNQTTQFLNAGDSWTLTGVVADPTKPVRVSLVWTDPPGVADPALVNDLDLTVTVGNNVYRGNVFSNGISTTGGAADAKNNVENVFLPAGIPAGTQFSIRVGATALNGNGILGNADTTDQHFALVAYNFTDVAVPPVNKNSDFDGDGRADISVFRPTGGGWFVTNSSNGAFVGNQFGTNGDLITPGDYDGDGKTDLAVFRPSNGAWYIMRSQLGFTGVQFGTNGDLPAQGDFDGDRKTDIAVFRPSDGYWYRLNSSNGQFVAAQFGTNGDKPVQADYDGDGKTDIAVFRQGFWYRLNSSNGQFAAAQFGTNGDKPVQADYDGDGKADIAVFRPSDGGWYLLRSQLGFTAMQFGISSDVPAPADFDGDGKSDIAVYRGGVWYQMRSLQGFTVFNFGAADDRPVPNGYLPQ
jgi:hypothetical protein